MFSCNQLEVHILDCTFRDGGYYNDWDFEDNIIDAYIESMNALPIDYLELGYRNNPSKEYLGKLAYCPVSVLRRVRKNSSKKLAIMLNEKNTTVEDLDLLLNPIKGLVDMVRIAVDPKRFDSSIVLAKAVKQKGFEVGFNTMYMSKWKEFDDFLDKLDILNGVVDLFVMVDSFGGITPNEVKCIVAEIKAKLNCPIGFHGHNNLQLGLINALTAIENGVCYVDATILGMGRGVGNLNMELLLTVLRGAVNANHNTWMSVLYDGQHFHKSKCYDITDIVDRVGGGDSFMGGLIFGLLHYDNDQDVLEFATAAGCLKHTLKYDFNWVTVQEVENLIKGDVSGRIRR